MYTNMAFGTDESVLFEEVSSVQGCSYREVPLLQYCVHKLVSTVPKDLSERLKAVILGGTFLIVSHCNYR